MNTIIFLVVPSINVTPAWLYRIICDQKHTVPVVPALLMAGGLLKDVKSDLVERFVETKEERPYGFAHYEIITSGLSPNMFLKAKRIHSSEFYGSSFLSCLGKVLTHGVNENGDSHKGNTFNDQKLNDHLQSMANKICETLKTTERTKQTSLTTIAKMETECFIKVWNLTFNSIAYQFLHCFAGYFHNSYMWLFAEDSDELHKPPQSKDGIIRRSRLEYFLRSSKLSSCMEEENEKRKRVCKIFTNQAGQKNMKLKGLEAEYLHAASQLGVQDYIDGEILPINFSETDRVVLLDHLRQQIGETPHEIPLSYLFLRSALDLEKSVFMTYDQLKQKATECGIEKDESFEDFCKYFTSFGSILVVNFVNPKCNIVIIKPDEFLSTLDHAFAPAPYLLGDAHKLSMNGIMTDELARDLFKNDKDKFTEVLEAVGLVTKVNRYSDESIPFGTFYYMPSARQCEEKLTCNQKAVQLITSVRYPSMNMEVALSKYILSNRQNAILQASNQRNVTKICFTEEGDKKGFIEIVYQGGVIEFTIESINPLAIVQIIVNGCKKIAEHNSRRFGESKYHFAVLCAKDKHELAYNFNRKRHKIPYNERCCQCPPNLHLKAWNEVLKKASVYDLLF